MRILLGTLLLLVLSACGAPTGETGGSTASITVDEPWVRAALLLDDASASGMAMGDASASGMLMEASNPAENPAAASDMSEEMEMGASGEGMDMGGAVSAGYMTLRNDGTEADRLVEASSDIAGEVQLHTSEMNNNVMSMRQVEGIDVPAGGTATLEPGSFHLMILDLKRDLKAAETVKLTLRFERAGTIEVDAQVRDAGE